jgi:hypothetical protein
MEAMLHERAAFSHLSFRHLSPTVIGCARWPLLKSFLGLNSLKSFPDGAGFSE